jgi:D-ribose pyranose/furanose isomerase RbsD
VELTSPGKEKQNTLNAEIAEYAEYAEKNGHNQKIFLCDLGTSAPSALKEVCSPHPCNRLLE